MKEVKRTPVPLPGSKAKSKSTSTSSKPALSQEFIGSDDDSASESRPQAQVVHRPKTTIAIHGPNGVTKSKAKSGAKEPATPKAASKAKAAPKQPAPKQVTQAQAAELSSSDETDDSDAPAQDVQSKSTGAGNQDDSSDSDGDSDSDSSSDDSDAKGAPQQVSKPTQSQGQPSQTKPHAVEFRPAQTFVPPKGFNPVPVNDKTKSKATDIFGNLQGKQIWHITAPAGLSLKDLSEIPMETVKNGQSFWDHKGASYGFSAKEQSDDGACEVMIPEKNGYKTVSTRISQSLHLQAVVNLPHLSAKQADQNTGSEAAASITRSTIRAPRPQLKGLKMRFFPTGFGGGDAGTLGDSDSEDNTPKGTAGLGVPNELNLPSRKEKRKHHEVNGDTKADSTLKKKKKKHADTPEERRARKEKKRAQAAMAKS